MILVKNGIAKFLMDEFHISPQTTGILFDKGILTDKACRDVLIKMEYVEKTRPKEKLRLRNKLAEKYCVSVSLIEKTVLENTQK
jgi:hypothetical protein